MLDGELCRMLHKSGVDPHDFVRWYLSDNCKVLPGRRRSPEMIAVMYNVLVGDYLDSLPKT